MSYKPFEQTAQLQFKNCLNFSKDEQVRGGCRGGRDQFSWDALRNMNYADRIHYLGQTVTIGYLDKGGKWRKRDWYTRVTDDDKNRIYDKMTINEEIKQTQDEDARRMRVAMGLEKVDDKTKTTQPNLTKDEVQELTKKTQYNPFLEETNEDKHQGLGLDRKGVAKPSLKLNTYGQTVLEAYGVQNEYQKPPQQQDDEISQAKKKIKKVKKQDKKEKNDEKKEKKSKKSKKDKKEKKDKKRDRKHNTSTDTDD